MQDDEGTTRLYPWEPAATLSTTSSIPPVAASWAEAAFWGIFSLAWKKNIQLAGIHLILPKLSLPLQQDGAGSGVDGAVTELLFGLLFCPRLQLMGMRAGDGDCLPWQRLKGENQLRKQQRGKK